MARGFTDIAIRNLKPGTVRREIPDPGARGLYVIVEPSGFKSFAARFRFQGKPKKLSFGNVPLSVARKLTADALHEAKEGRDPTSAKKQAKQARRAIEANTFGRVCDQYLKIVCGMKIGQDGKLTFNGVLRSAARHLAELNRLVLPTLGNKPISEIKRTDIVNLLDRIQTGELKGPDGVPIEGGPVAADRTLSLIRTIMFWHAARTDDFKIPLVRGMMRTKPQDRARDRILDDAEIRLVWNEASKSQGSFPAFIKFLLLTGARRSEASNMMWNEMKDGVWLLPPTRNKTKKPLARPLSRAALTLIESLRREGCGAVFSTPAGRPITVFAKPLAQFQDACGVSDFHYHDLRRTCRSLLSKAGVGSDIGERCLGHVVGGVKAVYDRHDYRLEMANAYERLSALITQIASPPPDGKVIALKKKRG
jgi:integrase